MPFDNTVAHILLIDDHESDYHSVQDLFALFSVKYALTRLPANQETIEHLSDPATTYQCILLKDRLDSGNSLHFLKECKKREVLTPITILTTHNNDVRRALVLIKNGAFDYVPPADLTVHKLSALIVRSSRFYQTEIEKQNALKDSKAIALKLMGLINSSSYSIFAIDKDFNYIAFNQAHFEAVKNTGGIEIKVGANVFETLPDLSSKVKDDYILPFSGQRTQGIHKSLSGSLYETTYNPLFDEQGNVTGVAVFTMDATHRFVAQNELLQAKQAAELAAKAKSDFLSNMSHEIRTPLNAIIGMSGLMLEKEMSPDNLASLYSIKYSADNLLVILNDILDFSKIEAGKITFEHVDFYLHNMLQELQKTFAHKAQEKNISLDLEIQPDVPNMLKGDPYRLNQILFNLVGNAIKFTHKGFVKIIVSAYFQPNQSVEILLEVTDSGIGIPNDKIHSIFDSFSQAYTDTTRKFGGTGLGLAITKNLTELQNGTISITSKVNQGSTFSVKIPYELSDNQIHKTKEKTTKPGKDLDQTRVLLVEDNPLNQLVVKKYLTHWNASVTIANNGKEAIDLMTKQSFDVVLMDLQMPEMSGYDATAFIRSESTTVLNPMIPIIALTADAFAETKRKVLETGMNDFVTKPFDQDELYLKIVKQLM